MGDEWFRVDASLADHPKLDVLEARLGPGAARVLLRIWSWARRIRRDGRFRPGEIDLAARCHAAAALIEAGFLEGDGCTLHDWMHHNGEEIAKLPAKRSRHAEYMKTWRLKQQAVLGAVSPPPHTPLLSTETATATGDASRDISRNASRNALLTNGAHAHEIPEASPLPDRREPPPGADQVHVAAYQEYRMAHGTDGYEAFARHYGAARAAGIEAMAYLNWHRANPGRPSWHANKALIHLPKSPASIGLDDVDRKIRQLEGRPAGSHS